MKYLKIYEQFDFEDYYEVLKRETKKEIIFLTSHKNLRSLSL